MSATIAEDIRTFCLGKLDPSGERTRNGRVLPGVRAQYFLPVYILAAIILLFQGLVIAGSPTNSAATFFLLRINETLVGYTGMCGPNSVCLQTAGSSAISELAGNMGLSDFTIIQLLSIQNSLSYSLPAAVCTFLGFGLILITILLYLKLTARDDDIARSSRDPAPLTIMAFCAMGAFWIATIFSWAAAYSAQVVISALIASSEQQITRGGIVHTFQWIIFSFTLLLTVITQTLIFPSVLPEMKDLYFEYSGDSQRKSKHVIGDDQDSERGPSKISNVDASAKSNSNDVAPAYGPEDADPPEPKMDKGGLGGEVSKSKNGMDDEDEGWDTGNGTGDMKVAAADDADDAGENDADEDKEDNESHQSAEDNADDEDSSTEEAKTTKSSADTSKAEDEDEAEDEEETEDEKEAEDEEETEDEEATDAAGTETDDEVPSEKKKSTKSAAATSKPKKEEGKDKTKDPPAADTNKSKTEKAKEVSAGNADGPSSAAEKKKSTKSPVDTGKEKKVEVKKASGGSKEKDAWNQRSNAGESGW